MLFMNTRGGASCGDSGVEPFHPARLIRIPQTGQATFYTCGVAALQSVLYHNGIECSQDVLELAVGTTPQQGTGMEDMRKFLNDKGVRAEIRETMTLRDLRGCIDLGRVVICILQAWDDEDGHDYSDTWNDGHYAIAIGYDDKRVYFMDPYTIANYTYVGNEALLTRWHALNRGVRYIKAGIVVTNHNPIYRQDAFVEMK
jgi:predicted double-glycine peptidase